MHFLHPVGMQKMQAEAEKLALEKHQPEREDGLHPPHGDLIMRMYILVLSAAFLALPVLAQTTVVKAAPTAAVVTAAPDIPAEVHQFYRDYNTALLSHDIKRIMPFFSDHYLHEGRNKAAQRTWILEWLNDLTRLETHLNRFTPIDTRRAYIEGRWDDNFTGGVFLPGTQLVKENGQWKLFGNQKRYDR